LPGKSGAATRQSVAFLPKRVAFGDTCYYQPQYFSARYEENAKSAVINILGVKFFFWIEKIFFASTSISQNVPTLTIRGVF
jgi:hypothetical protein